MIKPTSQIKKELKEKGWNLKGVKIKVERLYDFMFQVKQIIMDLIRLWLRLLKSLYQVL